MLESILAPTVWPEVWMVLQFLWNCDSLKKFQHLWIDFWLTSKRITLWFHLRLKPLTMFCKIYVTILWGKMSWKMQTWHKGAYFWFTDKMNQVFPECTDLSFAMEHEIKVVKKSGKLNDNYSCKLRSGA